MIPWGLLNIIYKKWETFNWCINFTIKWIYRGSIEIVWINASFEESKGPVGTFFPSPHCACDGLAVILLEWMRLFVALRWKKINRSFLLETIPIGTIDNISTINTIGRFVPKTHREYIADLIARSATASPWTTARNLSCCFAVDLLHSEVSWSSSVNWTCSYFVVEIDIGLKRPLPRIRRTIILWTWFFEDVPRRSKYGCSHFFVLIFSN